jgi:hypothetical protein
MMGFTNCNREPHSCPRYFGFSMKWLDSDPGVMKWFDAELARVSSPLVETSLAARMATAAAVVVSAAANQENTSFMYRVPPSRLVQT